jgi:hypothetical protein
VHLIGALRKDTQSVTIALGAGRLSICHIGPVGLLDFRNCRRFASGQKTRPVVAPNMDKVLLPVAESDGDRHGPAETGQFAQWQM